MAGASQDVFFTVSRATWSFVLLRTHQHPVMIAQGKSVWWELVCECSTPSCSLKGKENSFSTPMGGELQFVNAGRETLGWTSWREPTSAPLGLWKINKANNVLGRKLFSVSAPPFFGQEALLRPGKKQLYHRLETRLIRCPLDWTSQTERTERTLHGKEISLFKVHTQEVKIPFSPWHFCSCWGCFHH